MPDSGSGDAPSRVLRAHALRARKSLGQNFLQDLRVADKIVSALDLTSRDSVLEIGAGTGVLTDRLARHSSSLVAIELDAHLYTLLSHRFEDNRSVHLVHADAVQVNPCDLFAGDYKLVGNIPYYVTGPIVRHYLEARCRPSVLVFMVQREVADRMVAKAGHLSLLGVSVQFYARAELVARVPAGAFYPRPNVDSAVVRLTPFNRRYDQRQVELFFEVARAGFGTKRKQLINALGHGLELHRIAAIELLSDAGVDPTRRAETLSIEEWEKVARIYGSSRRQDS